ncbi:Listeria/Bacterioides repeat-containing protein [Pseudobutyrivibrio sp. OR37]|uniref:leucine-rich repeat domain-containing protein n=1 Tax=Pseudobutyrivibrio sp. OR37 TaxID=1798186 RepID=UPI0008EFE5FE|nr:leucine-rich repeat domain-containing protein [Pseudobutyrivibrio sp. OR37]SFI02749.1 Listeria/Bacterioides repeat-containing protein [Pseudobutyrivibrio sp. OR37]
MKKYIKTVALSFLCAILAFNILFSDIAYAAEALSQENTTSEEHIISEESSVDYQKDATEPQEDNKEENKSQEENTELISEENNSSEEIEPSEDLLTDDEENLITEEEDEQDLLNELPTSGKAGDNITWTYTKVKVPNQYPEYDYVLTLSGYGPMYDYSERLSVPWLKICEKEHKYIDKIIFDKRITHIGANAFSYTTIANYSLPENLESIGNNAFNSGSVGNTNNKCSLVLPSKLKLIDEEAFLDFQNVDEFHFTGDIPEVRKDAFKYVAAVVYYPGNNKTYTKAAMDKVSSCFEAVKWIPENGDITSGKAGENINWTYDSSKRLLTFTGSGAMYNYSATNLPEWYPYLKQDWGASLVFSQGITSIGDYAFYYADSIHGIYKNNKYESLIIPESVKRIGKHAFDQSSLGEVTFPKTMDIIDEYAFNRTGAETNTLPSGIKELGSYSLYATDISSILDVSKLKKIGENALCKNVAYKSNYKLDFNFPALETVGRCAFSGAENIRKDKKIILNDNVKSLGEFAFSNVKNVEGEFVVPKSITSFNFDSIYNLALSSVVLHENIKEIDFYNSGYLKNLVSIKFNGDLPNGAEDIYYNINPIKVYYPAKYDNWDKFLKRSHSTPHGDEKTKAEFIPTGANPKPANSHKVTFITNYESKGINIPSQYVQDGQCAKEPDKSKLKIANWSFVGWVDENKNHYLFNTPVKSDITLYAEYTYGYSVKFHPNLSSYEEDHFSELISYGIGNDTSQYSKGYVSSSSGLITVYAGINYNLCRKGYDFLGWYYDEALTKPVKTGDKLSDSCDFYAKWSAPKNITITYKLDNGKADVIQTVKAGTCTKQPAAPKKQKVYFARWGLLDKDSNISNQDFDFENTPIFEDTTFKAIYKDDKLKVTYKYNNDVDEDKTIDATFSTKLKPEPAPKREGYRFIGWKAQDSTTLFDFTTNIDRKYNELILEAVWEKIYESDITLTNGIPDKTYTGKPIVINNISLSDNGQRIPREYYKVSYANNTNVGKAKIIVNFKAPYSGTKVFYFNIVPKDISDTNISLNNNRIEVSRNNKVQKAKNKLIFNGKTLTENKDYTLIFPGTNPKEADYNSEAFKANGTYTVTIKGKGNFTGTRNYTVVINDYFSVNNLTVTGVQSTVNYKKIQQNIVVKYGQKVLYDRRNYTGNELVSVYYTYANSSRTKMYVHILPNKKSTQKFVDNKGVERILIGQKNIPFNVKGSNNLSQCYVEVVNLDKLSFDGRYRYDDLINNHVNVYTDKTKTKKLENYEDYIITNSGSIKNPKNVKLEIIGLDKYIGSKAVRYINLPAQDISKIDNLEFKLYDRSFYVEPKNNIYTFPYCKNGVKPEIRIKFLESNVSGQNDYVRFFYLEKDVDYVVKYYDFNKIGKARVEITGKGIYSGVKIIEYDIVKASFNSTENINKSLFASTDYSIPWRNVPGNYKIPVTVKDSSGSNLISGKDYKVEYYYNGKKLGAKDKVNPNSLIEVKLEAIGGGYIGKETHQAYVVAKSLSQAKITKRAKLYYQSSTSTTVKSTDFSLKYGNITLVNNKDYYFSYNINSSKNIATVTIYGRGDYAGKKTITFNVVPTKVK